MLRYLRKFSISYRIMKGIRKTVLIFLTTILFDGQRNVIEVCRNVSDVKFKIWAPRNRDRSAYHFTAPVFLYSCRPFGEVILARVSVRLQERIFNVLFEKLAVGRSPMCPGLSASETTHDE
jgi:hypothetical protein